MGFHRHGRVHHCTVGLVVVQIAGDKANTHQKDSLLSVGIKMLTDAHIWYITLMVGLFNIALFSYYSIAPFMFEKLGASVNFFGNTGFILALGSVLGSVINMKLIRMHLSHEKIVMFASWLLLIGGFGVFIMQESVWFSFLWYWFPYHLDWRFQTS